MGRYEREKMETGSRGRRSKRAGCALVRPLMILGIVFATCAPAASAETLPDGRAYEQVTPVDKNGGNAQGRVNLVQAAASGDAITFLSNAGVPGGEGAQNTPLFLSSRTGGGWSTIGLQPPASAGPYGGPIGWGEELSFSLSSSTVPGQSSVLYLREGATSSLVEIASGVEKPSYAGSSSDAREILFEDQASLAPGAVQGESNVYLWDRDNRRTSLVSVLNDGLPPAGGAVAGPYGWFGSSGGASEDYYTGPGHAISDNGEEVWFTSASGQLYLRVNPTEPQSPTDAAGVCTVESDACTVDVSASKKTNGRGPGGADLAGVRKAAFMTATPSGEEVFFTSPEKLTNDATTGPEPNLPGIARSTVTGEQVELDFLPADAKGVTVDGAHVYWAEPAKGAIGRASLDGGGIEEDFITGADNPQGVAVDGSHVYWTNAGNGDDGGGSIGRALIGGGAVEQDFIPGVVGGEDVVNGPDGIAADGEHIYWGNFGPEGSFDGGSGIMRAGLDGAHVERFTSLAATALTIAEGHLYFVRPQSQTAGGPLGFSCITRIEISSPGLLESFACGGQSVGQAEMEREYGGIAVVGGRVYWAIPNRGTIASGGLRGENIDFEYVEGAARPLGLAADSAHLYWSTNPEGSRNPGNDLYSYDVGTGGLSDLTVDVSDANGAEVQGVLGASNDGSRVYFVANGVLADGATTGDCSKAVGATSEYTGHCNLYLREGSATRFIARLNATGPPTESDAANWYPTTAVIPRSTQRTARVSDDGAVLLFRSQVRLTAYENQGVPELYRYDALTRETTCVSCDPSGSAPVGLASLRTDTSNMGVGTVAASLTRNLSSDGDRVFFESPDALVPGDVNGVTDVYEWEAPGTGTCSEATASFSVQDGGCLFLVSTGTGPQPSRFADASSSGDDVFFFTSQPLVAQDTDELVDIYDARVGGGIPSQNQVPPRPCSGEACRGAGPPAPGQTPPGSSSFTGPGNQRPAKPCRKGKVRKHGRCVKKSKRHRGKHHRQKPGNASETRRRPGQAGRAS